MLNTKEVDDMLADTRQRRKELLQATGDDMNSSVRFMDGMITALETVMGEDLVS